MGRSRGGLIAINLEPHIHFSKNKFTGKTTPENFPPNAGQLVLTSQGQLIQIRQKSEPQPQRLIFNSHRHPVATLVVEGNRYERRREITSRIEIKPAFLKDYPRFQYPGGEPRVRKYTRLFRPVKASC
jgi:hypothetical protein